MLEKMMCLTSLVMVRTLFMLNTGDAAARLMVNA